MAQYVNISGSSVHFNTYSSVDNLGCKLSSVGTQMSRTGKNQHQRAIVSQSEARHCFYPAAFSVHLCTSAPAVGLKGDLSLSHPGR